MFVSIKPIEREFEYTTASGKKSKRKRKSKLITLKCDNCFVEFDRNSQDMDLKRLYNYKHVCKNCKHAATQYGQKSRRNNLDKRIGEKCLDSMGYISIYMGKTHPYSKDYGGSIREHIIVMENHIGRMLNLEKGKRKTGQAEVVHHIDGDKTNNSLDNLDLCTVSEHNACHGASEKIVFELYKKGLVSYDRELKRYFLKD